MKTYDITIRLSLVDMGGGSMENVLRRANEATEQLTETLGGATHSAAQLESTEVIDRDSLPRAAHVCARCERSL